MRSISYSQILDGAAGPATTSDSDRCSADQGGRIVGLSRALCDVVTNGNISKVWGVADRQ